MGTISHVDPEQARYDPEAEFQSPFELVETVALTRGQKLSALKDWAFDVERRIAAASEGMPSRGHVSPDLKLLEDIRRAIEMLQHPCH